MRRSAGVAEAPARLLLKKAEVCELLSVGDKTFEKMLDDGRIPQPIWLGSTANSRRWAFATITRYIAGLSREADRAGMSPAHG